MAPPYVSANPISPVFEDAARGYAQSSPQRERFFEPCRDFVEELLRALVGTLRRARTALTVFLPAVFLVASRGLLAGAEAFLAGRLLFPGFDAGAEERLLLLTARGFTRAPTNAVAALDATFMAASTFALAALAIASCADGLSPSFFLSTLPPCASWRICRIAMERRYRSCSTTAPRSALRFADLRIFCPSFRAAYPAFSRLDGSHRGRPLHWQRMRQLRAKAMS